MIALITGITGQDGSYLTELLLSKNYEVHGIIRRNSWDELGRIRHLKDQVILHYGDLTDNNSLLNAVNKSKPDEVYNLAAQSDVPASFDCPEYTADVNASGTMRLLNCIRQSNHYCRFYQASTSELFGDSTPPQTMNMPFKPNSPYAIAKLYAYRITVNYREAFGIHASNGILFNHESPRRGSNFVTKKIAESVVAIKRGKQSVLKLGNIDARRDWGYAPDYVLAMWKILQQNEPGDYIISTGVSHSVRDFCELAFAQVGIPIKWVESESGTIAICTDTGRTVVSVNESYKRPADVNYLCGDSSKSREKLEWCPTITFEELVSLMVDFEMNKY